MSLHRYREGGEKRLPKRRNDEPCLNCGMEPDECLCYNEVEKAEMLEELEDDNA